jgi:hypothetical protein
LLATFDVVLLMMPHELRGRLSPALGLLRDIGGIVLHRST